MNICVFGASSSDINSKYIIAGEEMGRIMAEASHRLIFGGGKSGLMGAVARGVYEAGGEITGIAPTFFDKPGVLYENCDEFIFTETMRERKELMEQRADVFIMTPGGIGTMEEFFEIFTLKQLGRHDKPIGILNVDGYYNDLIRLLVNTVENRFMDIRCMDMLFISDDPQELLEILTK